VKLCITVEESRAPRFGCAGLAGKRFGPYCGMCWKATGEKLKFVAPSPNGDSDKNLMVGQKTVFSMTARAGMDAPHFKNRG